MFFQTFAFGFNVEVQAPNKGHVCVAVGKYIRCCITTFFNTQFLLQQCQLYLFRVWIFTACAAAATLLIFAFTFSSPPQKKWAMIHL